VSQRPFAIETELLVGTGDNSEIIHKQGLGKFDLQIELTIADFTGRDGNHHYEITEPTLEAFRV
jgi:hypothetical protein